MKEIKNAEWISMKEVESVYRALYEDQKEGAIPEYLEEFEQSFNPDNVFFLNPTEAKAAMLSLIKELEEDRTDIQFLFEQAGLTDDMLKWLGREDLLPPAPVESSNEGKLDEAAWVKRIEETAGKAFKDIPKEELTQGIVDAYANSSAFRNAIRYKKHLHIPAEFFTKGVILAVAETAKDMQLPSLIKEVPQERLNKEMVLEVVSSYGGEFFSSMPLEQRRDEELCAAVMEMAPTALSGVPIGHRSLEVCEAALRKAISLRYDNEKKRGYREQDYSRVLQAVPGDLILSISLDIKTALVKESPELVKVFAYAGEFTPDENGNYTKDAWEVAGASLQKCVASESNSCYIPAEAALRYIPARMFYQMFNVAKASGMLYNE